MGTRAVTLDEAASSDLSDPAMRKELDAVAYDAADKRPVWIGAHRPVTSCADLEGHAAWALAHYSFYLTFVRDFMETRGVVLDIGCGAGQNTAMLARYSAKTIGLDSDETAIAFAKKHNAMTGVRFIHARFPFVPDPQFRFSYIFCIETMEHVEHKDQKALIRAALEMLTPDGLMFLTTPNEADASPPHIGIWQSSWAKEMLETFTPKVVKHGYFSNQDAAAGFSTRAGSHFAMVLHP